MQPGTARRPSSVQMLRRLIAFPTVSRDSNLELIHFVRGILEPYGAEMRLTHDDARRKTNLFATLGPRGEPGILL
ncbi:MAG: acetylornithine deacetylase, partial [Burkholderiales bacterium]